MAVKATTCKENHQGLTGQWGPVHWTKSPHYNEWIEALNHKLIKLTFNWHMALCWILGGRFFFFLQARARS